MSMKHQTCPKENPTPKRDNTMIQLCLIFFQGENFQISSTPLILAWGQESGKKGHKGRFHRNIIIYIFLKPILIMGKPKVLFCLNVCQFEYFIMFSTNEKLFQFKL